MSAAKRTAAVAIAATLAVALGMIVAPWWGHVDDGDAHLYRVVARHMVEDGTWFDLRYLPGAHARFREHLPFGLWPYALAIRIFGEASLPWIGAFFTLSTVGVVLVTGWRMAGPAAGIVSALVLSTTESFALYGGRERLDPPLVLFAALSMMPLLAWPLNRRTLAISAGFGAAAALVKGPFGLVGVFAAAGARALQQRTPRSAAKLAIVVALSAAPVVGFLLWSRWRGDRTWWDGFLIGQLWASATGGRMDGSLSPWFPVSTLMRRFWPGLPLVAVGAYAAVRGAPKQTRELRLLAVAAALVVAALCLPARKLWNHALVVYPLLALLGGVAVAPFLERRLQGSLRARAAAAVGALAAAVWIAVIAGAGRRWLQPPCIPAGPVEEVVGRLRPGEELLVVSSPVDWSLVAALASERRVVPWPVENAAGGIPEGSRPRLALVSGRQADRAPSRWREVARSPEWVALVPPEASAESPGGARARAQ